jgi:hypothetical protein
MQRATSIAFVLALTLMTLLIVAFAAGAPDCWPY